MSKVVDLDQYRAVVALHDFFVKEDRPKVVLRHTCGCNFFLISDAGILCGECKEILGLHDVENWIDEQNK